MVYLVPRFRGLSIADYAVSENLGARSVVISLPERDAPESLRYESVPVRNAGPRI